MEVCSTGKSLEWRGKGVGAASHTSCESICPAAQTIPLTSPPPHHPATFADRRGCRHRRAHYDCRPLTRGGEAPLHAFQPICPALPLPGSLHPHPTTPIPHHPTIPQNAQTGQAEGQGADTGERTSAAPPPWAVGVLNALRPL